MNAFVVVLLSFILVPSIVLAEVISLNLTSSDEICLEATVNLTCRVNGTVLVWRFGGDGGETRLYDSPSPNNLVILGSSPFSTRVTDVSGGIITSIATTSNLTRDANGMTLECFDGLFTLSNTDRKEFQFSLGDFMPPLLTDPIDSNTTIFSILSRNKCNPTCQTTVISKTGAIVYTTDCSSPALLSILSYAPPQNERDVYTFNVSNLDSSGQSIASNSFNFSWNISDFEVNHYVYEFNILIITITVPSINQPEMLTCTFTLMGCENGGLCDSPRSCMNTKVFQFNVTKGSYTYNVIITNSRGPSSRTGFVQVDEPPVATTPTSSSTMTVASSTTSVISSSPTPSPTSPPSEQDNTTTIALAIALGLSGLWCALSIPWCILHLCWRHCFCCLALWTLSIWRYVFCECFRKEPKPIVPSDETISKSESSKKDESNL